MFYDPRGELLESGTWSVRWWPSLPSPWLRSLRLTDIGWLEHRSPYLPSSRCRTSLSDGDCHEDVVISLAIPLGA